MAELAGWGTPTRLAVRIRTRRGVTRGSVYGVRAGDPANPTKVLFLHGLGITHATWWRTMPVVAEVADCLAVDLLGFGYSRVEPGGDVSVTSQAVMVDPLLDAVGWSRAVVVGHSMGGGAALGAALAFPRRVAGLVLVGSIVYRQEEPWQFRLLDLPATAEALAGAARLAVATGCDTRLGRMLFSHNDAVGAHVVGCLAEPAVARAFVAAARDLRDLRYGRIAGLVGGLRQPVLILHGRHDQIVPTNIPLRLYAELPDGELVWFERADHMPQESHGDEVGTVIAEFLARRFPGGCPAGARGVQ